MDWYDNIEMPIRNIVRLLRDNGYNTTNSSGDDMIVEIDVRKMDDMEDIAVLLVHNGYKIFNIIGYIENIGCIYWRRRVEVRVSGGGRI